ncbi:BTB/POZ domain-containing protein 3-like [Lutzomyia longipalpis]|uniref:BTB/POZ domain-containing protein 3-like n=1 Tax=Lutzomyia longipalpis TaxID=7200 RepID=UPI002483508E|nr:BTB/POZ domain-containing protein 3-like [Lutzomyia longipalpis]
MASRTKSLSYEDWSFKFGKITGQFSNYFNDNSLSDVTFLVGKVKQKIPGHKFILSSCSWDFYILFQSVRFDHDTIHIEDFPPETFLCFLKFCYMGQVDLVGKDAWGVLKLAYRFNVKQLITNCEAFLGERAYWDNCLEFYTKSRALREDTPLQKQSLELIQRHFDEILLYKKSFKDFLKLPVDIIEEISSLENFQCDEILIFNGLMNWAKESCKKENLPCVPPNFRKVLRGAFKEIRFPVMGLKWFTEILVKYPDLLTPNETADILRYIRKEANDCPGFKSSYRKCSINHPKHFISNPYTFVECFYNGPVKTNVFSSQMSIKFKCTSPGLLKGFGYFVSKTNKAPKIISLQLTNHDPLNEIRIVQNLNYHRSNYFALQSDYGFRQELLEQGESLASNQWYTLTRRVPQPWERDRDETCGVR